MAIRTDGTVRCWGLNGSYQCSPPTDLGPCVSVAAGQEHSIALQADGAVKCWGWNVFEQCTVPTDLGQCSSIASGWYHSLAIRSDGTVRIWGAGGTGQNLPPTDLGTCTRIAAGHYHSVAIVELDADGDGDPDSIDNCPTIANPTQADCNDDGIGDACELATGAPDFNHDTIPDNCQCIADLVLADHQVNGADLGALLSQWGLANVGTLSDMNRDGRVDGADLGHLLASWGPCSN